MQAKFEQLKEKLTRPPDLPLLEYGEPFIEEIDAFSEVIGAVLSEKKDDRKTRPIYSASGTTNSAERN